MFLGGFFLHQWTLEYKGWSLSFNLQKVYAFHAVFSLVVCLNFLILSKVEKLAHQLGFLYFGAFFVKIVLFALLFSNLLFKEGSLAKFDSISLLIPLFLF